VKPKRSGGHDRYSPPPPVSIMSPLDSQRHHRHHRGSNNYSVSGSSSSGEDSGGGPSSSSSSSGASASAAEKDSSPTRKAKARRQQQPRCRPPLSSNRVVVLACAVVSAFGLFGAVLYTCYPAATAGTAASLVEDLPKKLQELVSAAAAATSSSSSSVSSAQAAPRRNSINDNGNVLEFRSQFVSHWISAVDQKVEVHSASWFRHVGSYRSATGGGGNVTAGSIAPSKSEQQRQQQLLLRKRERQPANEGGDSSDAVIWDREEDIQTYFDTLEKECAKNADFIKDEFDRLCLDYMLDLISAPRCTMRLDSRTICSGGDNRDNNAVPIESILGAPHLTEDTLNLVILGAGPVGLYMANVLQEMQKQPSYKGPPIRIVIFENRVAGNGHKRPYTRDWITGLGKFWMKGALDERILRILDLLFHTNNSVLPIHAWETLLLMSTRNHGVKFVYDDIHDYKPILRQVPNLLFLDATGHRLSPLNRGESDADSSIKTSSKPLAEDQNSSQVTTVVSNWTDRSSDFMREFVDEYWHSDMNRLNAYGMPLRVAQRVSPTEGNLLYPVDNDGNAYDIQMVKVLNLPKNMALEGRLSEIRRAVNDKFKKGRESEWRTWWTGPHFYWTTDEQFREDIRRRITGDYQGRIATRTFFIILTQAQGRNFEQLVRKYSVRGESEIPLSRIPREEFTSNPVWLENLVGEAILLAMRYDKGTAPEGRDGPITISTFRYRPYIYTDPIVPGGVDLGMGQIEPIVRIGDSLCTGDVNAGSGLEMHFQTLRYFQCKLLNLTDDDHLNCDLVSCWRKRRHRNCWVGNNSRK